MTDLERIKHHAGGPHPKGSKTARPYGRPIHHSPFFWTAAFFMLFAMAMFVFSDGELFRHMFGPRSPWR